MDDLYISFFGLHRYNAASLWGKLFNCRMFDAIDDIPLKGFKHGEDGYLNMHIMPRLRNISFINNNIYYYRFGGMTSRYSADFFSSTCEQFAIKKEFIQQYPMRHNATKYIRIEFLNCVKTEVQQLIRYNRYSKEGVLREIERIVNMPEYQESLDIRDCSNKCEEDFFVAASCVGDYELMYELSLKKVRADRFANFIKQTLSKLLA